MAKSVRRDDYERILRTDQGDIIDRIKKAGLVFVSWEQYGSTISEDRIELEPLPPDERYGDLQKLFDAKTKSVSQLSLFPDMEEARFDRVALVDILHFLMGLADAIEICMN